MISAVVLLSLTVVSLTLTIIRMRKQHEQVVSDWRDLCVEWEKTQELNSKTIDAYKAMVKKYEGMIEQMLSK